MGAAAEVAGLVGRGEAAGAGEVVAARFEEEDAGAVCAAAGSVVGTVLLSAAVVSAVLAAKVLAETGFSILVASLAAAGSERSRSQP